MQDVDRTVCPVLIRTLCWIKKGKDYCINPTESREVS